MSGRAFVPIVPIACTPMFPGKLTKNLAGSVGDCEKHSSDLSGFSEMSIGEAEGAELTQIFQKFSE